MEKAQQAKQVISQAQQKEFTEKFNAFRTLLIDFGDFNNSYDDILTNVMSYDNKTKIMNWFYSKSPDSKLIIDDITIPQEFIEFLTNMKIRYTNRDKKGGSRRRPSRKYKKSAKRVFRKKSRSTRRR